MRTSEDLDALEAPSSPTKPAAQRAEVITEKIDRKRDRGTRT